MTQDPDVMIDATQAVEADPSDSRVANATPIVHTPGGKAERANIVDAIVGELRRGVEAAKNLKPADVATLARVVDNAAKLAIELRVADLSDAKVAKSLERRTKLVDAQLANIKAMGTDRATAAVWTTIDKVLDRLTGFAVAAAVAAI